MRVERRLGLRVDDRTDVGRIFRGSPTLSASIAPAIIPIIVSATSSWTNRTRSAEQRWPALWKDEAMTSRVTCSGNAELSTIIAFWPPVSAINGMIGPSRSARLRLMARRSRSSR